MIPSGEAAARIRNSSAPPAAQEAHTNIHLRRTLPAPAIPTRHSGAPRDEVVYARALRSAARGAVKVNVSPPPPKPDNAAHREEAQQLWELADRVESLNHYELLQVPIDAAPEHVKRQYCRLAKRWHPERMVEIDPFLQVAAEEVLIRLTQAFQVLSDDTRRKQYDEALAGAANPRQTPSTKTAAFAFRRAEQALKTGDIPEATRCAAQAMAAAPQELEYQALHAYLLSRGPQHQASRDLLEFVRVIAAAVTDMPNNVQLRLYLAELCQRCGKPERARHEYRKVVELEPSNVTALRELKLQQLRAKQDVAAASNTLLSRIRIPKHEPKG